MAEGSPSGGQTFEIRVLAELVLSRGWEGKICSMPPSWLLVVSGNLRCSLACSCTPPILTCVRPHTGPSPSPLHILPKWLHCVWPPPPCCSCSVTSDSLWPTDCSTPGSSVLHCLPEFAQTHIHWVISMDVLLLKLTSIELFHSFIIMYNKDMYLLYYAFIYLTNQIQCCRLQLQWHKNFILTTHLTFDMTGRSTLLSTILRFSDEETGAPAFKQCRGL